ncbi:uncharacterized protein LOC106176723 [Lingula anatina]|uniref:Uncharacterized protein LOC106176723 n=1 Tax=Lingula anatina TaxID=7574 RepID=A0A1S3JXA2_LINAN|nr:uncharacterized protein LOC106176723 [Lingula anatina]|eukprot:XP_013414681.1 uncharacterized protein LOC106176723 [Lingula anatina]
MKNIFLPALGTFISIYGLFLCTYIIDRRRLLTLRLSGMTDNIFRFIDSQNNQHSINESLESSRIRNGVSEKEQMFHFWYKCDKSCRDNSSMTRLSHTITLSFTGPRIRIFIMEYQVLTDKIMSKIPSAGGSNFRIELIGMEFILCPVRDYLNGSYVGYCPDINSSVNGTIYLDYTRYEAFVHHHDGHVSRQRVRHPGRIHRILNIFYYFYSEPTAAARPGLADSRKCKETDINEYLKGRWWYVRGQWRWGTNDGCIFDFMKHEQLRKCFNNKITFRLFGDSHIRNIGEYFNSLISKRNTTNKNIKYIQTLQKIVENEGAIFEWSPYMKHMPKYLSSFFPRYNSTPATKQDVVLLSAGIHEMVFGKARVFLESLLPNFVNFLSTVRKDERTANLRLIYINIPPRMHGDQDANEYMLAAVNQILKENLEKYQVEIIDGFNILNPMRDTSCDDGIHFLCPGSAAGEFTGHQGMTLAHLVFRVICDN